MIHMLTKSLYRQQIEKKQMDLSLILKKITMNLNYKTTNNLQKIFQFTEQLKQRYKFFMIRVLFDNCANADKFLEDFLFTTRRINDVSEQVNDVV